MEFLPQFIAGHVIIPLVEYVSMDERLEVAANLERLRQKASKEPCEHLLAVITQMLLSLVYEIQFHIHVYTY